MKYTQTTSNGMIQLLEVSRVYTMGSGTGQLFITNVLTIPTPDNLSLSNKFPSRFKGFA